MKSEMDLMRMDERQRFHWLRANRATLMFVGVVWLLMNAFDALGGDLPAAKTKLDIGAFLDKHGVEFDDYDERTKERAS